jgi:EmrB/QacA subfamily drug resistance transporter
MGKTVGAEKEYGNRWLILINVVFVAFMVPLDASVVNVALPVMTQKLSVTSEAISWVLTSYLIVISATVLIFGRLADLRGKSTVFRYGVLVFALGSLLCGISDSFGFLIAARIVQALGGAAAMATNQGIVTQVFPANERGRALGISAFAVALGSLVGPPLGGFIVSVLSWKFIFLMNVPLGVIAYVMGVRILPKRDHVTGEKMDIKGALLFSLAIVLLFGSLISEGDSGGANPFIGAGFITAVILMVIFVRVEKRHKTPLLQLEIFKNSLYSLSIFCAFISFVCISATILVQPFYLESTLKLSPALTGLVMMAYPVVLSIVAPVGGYLSDRIGSEFLTFLGLIMTSLGLFLMSTLGTHSSVSVIVCFVAIMAAGNGIFQSPNNSLVMSLVSRDKLGIAGSINALVRNLGMVFGVSMSSLLLYNRMSSKLGVHVTNYAPGMDEAFTYGMKVVYIAAAVLCAGGAALTMYRLYGRKARMEASAGRLANHP